MTTNEGVGKKIVEALKKQSNPEIEFSQTIEENNSSEFSDNSIEESVVDSIYGESIQPEVQKTFEDTRFEIKEGESVIDEAPMNSNPEVAMEPQGWNFQESQEIKPSYTETPAFDKLNSQEAKQFDMPPNVAVLKRLITQLPTGVTKQTGAQIIKQTMEALGISMNTVLHEAQKVQDDMNESIKNCMLSIQEYKNNIKNLEKQGLDYQRQVNQLNDLISLFILSDKD